MKEHIHEGAPINECDHCGDPPLVLAAGNGHPGLVVDDCVRFRVDVMILGERRVDVNPLGGLALPLAREVVGVPITPVKRRSIISPMKGRAR